MTEDRIVSPWPPFELVGLFAEICGIKDANHRTLLQSTLTEASLRGVQQTYYREGLLKREELDDEGTNAVFL